MTLADSSEQTARPGMNFDPHEHGHPYAFQHATPRWMGGRPMRGRGWAGGSLLLQLALIPILFAVALALFGDRDVESSAGTPSPEPVDQVGGEPFGHAIQVRSSHGPVTAPRYSRQQEAGAPD